MSRHTVLTESGRTLVAVALVGYLVGVFLGWTESMVIAAACLLVLALGVPFVVGRQGVQLDRELSTDKVTVGDIAEARLRINQSSSGAMRRLSRSIDDHVAGRRVSLALPTTGGHVAHRLPTDRRGVFTVGPAVIATSDPLGLLRREVRHTGTDILWVRPRVTLVNPVPLGFAKDLEGPTTDTSPAGDVAFHALRPYQLGDDHRHIHWMSTARTGSVMVRHHVDNRLPSIAVLLDPRHTSVSFFEASVSVAGSVVSSHLSRGLPTTLSVGNQTTPTRGFGVDDVLDQLCLIEAQPVEASEFPLAHWATRSLTVAPDTSTLVIVTSVATANEVLVAGNAAQHRANVIVVGVGDVRLPARIGRATTLSVAGLDDFAVTWNRRVLP